jgi:hypothetical protein
MNVQICHGEPLRGEAIPESMEEIALSLSLLAMTGQFHQEYLHSAVALYCRKMDVQICHCEPLRGEAIPESVEEIASSLSLLAMTVLSLDAP